MFMSLQKDLINKGLTEEEIYPYNTNGWLDTLKPKPDLANFSSEISLHYMARIGRKEVDMSMKLNDILEDIDLIDEWQDSDKTIREAKNCLGNKRDPPYKKEPVRTLIINKECYLDGNLLVRTIKSNVDLKLTKIIIPEK